jgi:hypothetical protein
LSPQELQQYRNELLTSKFGPGFKNQFSRLNPTQKLNYIKSLPNKTAEDKELVYVLSKLQSGGNIPMAQAGVNQNSVNNQDDLQIPMMKPRSSQEVWAATEPQIREAWGLGQKDATPEIEQNPFAVKFKNKNMYNIDFERGVNQFNTGANMFLSAVGERGDREREAQMFNNLTADNLYSASNTINRGNYDPNSGLFRQDEMGFTGVAKKGGSTYKEGGQTYMSAKQIADFLANGGEIEFI